MNTSKMLATAIAAASIVGGVGFAYAQTTTNDTTAQSRPADQGMQTQPMDATSQPNVQSPRPLDSTDRTTQPQNLQGSGATMQPNVQAPQPMDSTERMKQEQNKTTGAGAATMQPNVQSPRPLDSTRPMTQGSSQNMPQGSPDSGTPYSPATATDNTTVPSNGRAPAVRNAPAAPAAPMSSDTSAMPAGTERAPQADRN